MFLSQRLLLILFTMINSENFTKRLKKVMQFYGISASAFADKIGVQRSSISHILSGRNKPSLEFVMKVLSSYPEVELYWLLNGKGTFPSDSQELEQKNKTATLDTNLSKEANNLDEIDRIVIFFKDGSFKNYDH
jgi:transcriptional regulator with XRE-family HTH domain